MNWVVAWFRGQECIAVEGDEALLARLKVAPGPIVGLLTHPSCSLREIELVARTGFARTWLARLAHSNVQVLCSAAVESRDDEPAVRVHLREIVEGDQPPAIQSSLSEEIFSTAPDGLALIRNGIVLHVNARMLELAGLTSPDEVIGRSIFPLLDLEPTEKDREYPNVRMKEPSGQGARCRVFVRFPDPHDPELGIVEVDDLSSVEFRDQLVSNYQASLAGLLRDLSGGTFLFRTDRNLVELSPESAEVLGLPRAPIVVDYDAYMELVHPDDRYECELLTGSLPPHTPAVIMRQVRIQTDQGYRSIELNYFAADSGPTSKPSLIVGTMRAADRKEGTEARILELNRELAERAADLQFAKTRLENELANERELEKTLRASEELYRSLIELSVDGIAYAVNRRVAMANRALLDMLGAKSSNDVLGAPTEQFLSESSAEIVSRAFTDRTFGVWVFDRLEILNLDRSVTIPVEIRIVRFPKDDEVHSVSIIRDTRVRDEAERESRRSLARWQFALEGAGHGLWEFFPIEDRIQWSPPCWTMLGYSPVGLPMETVNDWMGIVHPDDRPRVYRHVLRSINKRGPGRFEMELRLRAKDGSYRWVQSMGTVIERDEQNNPRYVLGFHSDITEQRDIERELDDNRQRLSLALEGSGDAIWEWYPERQLTIYDDRWFTMLGYQPGELKLQTLDDWKAMVHPDDFEPAWRAQSAHMAGETTEYSFQIRLKCKSGEWKWIHTRGRVVERDAHGNPVRFIGLHSDVDDEVRAREALRSSQEDLARIVEASKTGVWAWWPDQNRLEVSAGFRSILGLDPHMAADTTEEWNRRLHPDDVEAVAMQLERHFSGEVERLLYEARYRRADGSYCWLLISTAIRERDEQGRPTLIAGTSTDISELKEAEAELERLNKALQARNDELERVNSQLNEELIARKRMEASLREAEERWQFALEGSEQGVWDWDPVANTGFWSPRWMEILGYSPGELDLDRVEDFKLLVHPDDFEVAWEKQMAHYRGETPFYQAEFRMKTRDGSWKWIHSRGKVISRAEDGTPLRYVGTHTDIDERKRTEAKIEQLYVEQRLRAAELEASNQELEAFSYSVSHDLRAPLRRIDGYSAAILEDCGEQLDAEGRASLDRIRINARQMGQVIDALLMLSRVTRREVHHRRVDLSAIADSLVLELCSAHPERRFDVRIQPDLFAFADPDLMKIMLENLFSNAIKFTADREVASIEFGQNGEGEFFVRDNGVGFDPSYSSKLFRPFERLHGPQEFEGHGIGLATVQRVLSRHGGRAWAEGEVGKGATIWFTLDSEPKD